MVGSRRRVLTCIAIGLFSLDCRTASNTPPSAADVVVATVPSRAPNHWPAALFDSLGTVMAPSGHGAPMRRGVISVVFNQGVDQPTRAAAIASVHGTVVGGIQIWDDGEYLVRIAGLNYTDIGNALAIIRPQTGVAFAFPVFVDTLSLNAQRKPPPE